MRAEGVEEPVGGPPYGRAELLDAARGEGTADQAANAGVVGRVHVEEVGVEGGRESEAPVTPGCRMPLVQGQPWVGEGLADVVVPGDEPGGTAVGSGDPVHRGCVAQPPVHVVRVIEEAVGEIHGPQTMHLANMCRA